MPYVDRRSGLEVLERRECLELLASHPVGRVAVVLGSSPLIFPVNYALDGDSIVFRSDEGSKLAGARNGFHMSFEIDGIDDDERRGWSVVVNGVGREVVDATELARMKTLDLHPWSPGAKGHWIRIRPETMTGRRLARPSEEPKCR